MILGLLMLMGSLSVKFLSIHTKKEVTGLDNMHVGDRNDIVTIHDNYLA